jgi:hypothetical protein
VEELPEYVKRLVEGLVTGFADFDKTYGRVKIPPTAKEHKRP